MISKVDNAAMAENVQLERPSEEPDLEYGGGMFAVWTTSASGAPACRRSRLVNQVCGNRVTATRAHLSELAACNAAVSLAHRDVIGMYVGRYVAVEDNVRTLDSALSRVLLGRLGFQRSRLAGLLPVCEH